MTSLISLTHTARLPAACPLSSRVLRDEAPATLGSTQSLGLHLTHLLLAMLKKLPVLPQLNSSATAGFVYIPCSIHQGTFLSLH